MQQQPQPPVQPAPAAPAPRPRVVVCGGGFAGRRAARALRRCGALDVTLVDATGAFEFVPAALRCCVHPAHASASVLPQPAGTLVARATGVELSPPSAAASPAAAPRATRPPPSASPPPPPSPPLPRVTALLLSDGTRLPCDWVLFATGSTYAAPIKAEEDWRHHHQLRPGDGDSAAAASASAQPAATPAATPAAAAAARRAHYRRVAVRLEASPSVLVVGGGTVGVELAAELASRYPDRGAKPLTLVCATGGLLPRMPPAAGAYAAAWLRARGVRLVLGERVAQWGDAGGGGGGGEPCACAPPPPWGEPGQWRAVTDAGTRLGAGAVLLCAGGAPATGWLAPRPGGAPGGLPAASLSGPPPQPPQPPHPPSTTTPAPPPPPPPPPLAVDGHLRVRGVSNAFAAGDCCAHGAEATALAADLSADVAAANLAACAASPRGGARLLRWPADALGLGPGPAGRLLARLWPPRRPAAVPAVAAVSLGPYSGLLQVNALLVRGPPAAAAKACVEALQLGVARERRLPAALWAAGEAVAVVAAARLFGGAGGGGG